MCVYNKIFFKYPASIKNNMLHDLSFPNVQLLELIIDSKVLKLSAMLRNTKLYPNWFNLIHKYIV